MGPSKIHYNTLIDRCRMDNHWAISTSIDSWITTVDNIRKDTLDTLVFSQKPSCLLTAPRHNLRSRLGHLRAPECLKDENSLNSLPRGEMRLTRLIHFFCKEVKEDVWEQYHYCGARNVDSDLIQ